MSDDLCLGILIGLVAAGALGLLFQQLYWSYKKAGEAGRPQKVSLETKKTPMEVVQSSAAAGCLFIALLAVVLFLAWLGIQLLFGS